MVFASLLRANASVERRGFSSLSLYVSVCICMYVFSVCSLCMD